MKQDKKKKKIRKIHLKKGDQVIVLAGADKGVKGAIRSIDRIKYRAIVEGVRMIKRHTKPNTLYPNGGIIEKEDYIHISNLMLIDPKTGEPTKVGRKREGDKIVRYAKKSGGTLS